MNEELVRDSNFQFIPEIQFEFIKEERMDALLANQEALAAFVKANPTLSETEKKLAEFLVALNGSASYG